MKQEKKWGILNKLKVNDSRSSGSEFKIEDLIKVLLANRGIKTKKEIEEFLNPRLENVTVESVGIDKKQFKKAILRIELAIKNKEQIIVFGDYDVDGICGSAILWETLTEAGAKALPYIPHRLDEGYGLSKIGIDNLLLKNPRIKIIITVDNGIVAGKAVEYANKKGIDIIITDHHIPSKNLPKAYAIVHTTKLCGAGVAYLLAQEIKNVILRRSRRISGSFASAQDDNGKGNTHLELVALATIADLVPLTGANRILIKFGIEALRKTKRPGLLALIEETEIEKELIDIYEIGHVIAPRLNAMGRLEYAMDSLRLLCTKDLKRAEALAKELISTNKRRQELTIEALEHARMKIQNSKVKTQNLIFIAHESYQQGVIGLVAGRLVEEFYRPSIVLSIGEKYSKASARSISGFNIIEFIREASDLLVDAGGHPMAAGFTVETSKIAVLEKKFEELAIALLNTKKLERILMIDTQISLKDITNNFYSNLLKLSPFGIGNPKPTFVSRKVAIEDMRLVGVDGKHLKLRLQQSTVLDAIAFGMGERANELHIGDAIDVVYTIDQDRWNGNNRLQLKIKDLRKL